MITKIMEKSFYGYLIISVLFILIGFAGCSSVKPVNKINAIALLTKINVIEIDGISPLWRDTTYIASRDGVNIYLIPDDTLSSVPTGSVDGGPFLRNSIYKLFRFEGSGNTGIYFESLQSKGQPVSKDSFLTSLGLIRSEANDSLYNTVYIPEQSLAIKTFIPKTIRNASYPDSIYVYYSTGFKNAPLNLLEKENTFKNLQAFKVQNIFNKADINTGNGTLKRKMEFVFEMSNIDPALLRQFEPYFKIK
jgi:hypothetical protein